MSHDPEMLERAQLGQQVQEFWDSSVGNYLRNRATELYTTAIAELKSCNPTDWQNIAKHQSDAFKAESFIQWMEEAISDGLRSLEILQNGDDE